MARKNRQISQSGIYHVILRGVNKQRIFEQSEDYDAMYRILHYVRTTDTLHNPTPNPNYFLYAYCIMDNHIHLLIQPNDQALGDIMKRIMATYAIYFNKTYERIGHLFQDRYKSEVVEDRKYFFTLLNYIHNNPVNAGICDHPSKYPYSSFVELASGSPYSGMQNSTKTVPLGTVPDGTVSRCCICSFPELSNLEEMEAEYHRTAEAMRLWERDRQGPKPIIKSMNLLAISPEEIYEAVGAWSEKKHGLGGLFECVKQMVQGSESALCQELRVLLDWQTAEEKDNAIVRVLLEMTGTSSISEFQRLDRPTMRTALAIVRDSGIGDRRLSRLTGISRGVIQRASICKQK